MCKPTDEQLQEQTKVAEPVTIETHQEEQTYNIREELTRLQTWDVGEGQTLEERRLSHAELMIQHQQEDNTVLLANVQTNLPPVVADMAAPGVPVQEQVPAKKTFKQRREEARRDKEAKKHNKDADHISYAAVQDLKQLSTTKNNSYHLLTEEQKRLVNTSLVDGRVLRTFCQGYRTKKNGTPASDDDARRQAEDAAFLNAYCSRDLQQRRPYLERFTKELLEVKLTPDMFSDAYMEQHAAEVKLLSDRLTYFQNIQTDPINAPFFQNMNPMERELLNAKLDALTGPFCTMLVNRLATRGVNCDGGGYCGSDGQVQVARQMDAGYTQILDDAFAQAKQSEEEIVERYTQQVIEAELPELMEGAQSMKEQAEHMDGLEGLNLTSFVTGYSFDELSRFRGMIEANPAAYAEHKEVLDHLYQELYRSIDAMGDISVRAMACQSVCDKYNKGSAALSERLVTHQASKQQEALMKRLDFVRDQVSSVADAMQFYLRDKPLSQAALLLLERSGYGNAAQALVAERAVKKAFNDPGGVVERSNAAYKAAKDRDASPSAIRSEALQALGIRTSSTDAAKADKLLRGTTYIGLPGDIAVYFHTLEDIQNLDLTLVSTQMQKQAVGLGAFSYGGGIDPINTQVLTLYRNYVSTPQSISYLKKMTTVLKDADVFGGNPSEIIDYLSQCLLNSYGANHSEVFKQQDSYRTGADVLTVARESCRTLLTLPALMRMTPEEQADLPQATQELLVQYRQLLRELTDQVAPPVS